MADATLGASVGFALYAGVLTFFSPCAYPLLPGYVGFYVSQTGGRSTLGGSLTRGLIAGVGSLLTLGAFIVATFLVGQSTLENVRYLEHAVGVLLIAFGALVIVDRAPSLSIPLPKRRSGPLGFAAFGAGYAVAAAGCVAPLFLSVVAIATTSPTAQGALIAGAYVATVVGLMISLTVAAGTGLLAGGGWVMRNRERLERLAGVVLVAAGIGQLYVAFYLSQGI